MQYLLLIYAAESHEADMSDGARGELFAAYGAYTEEVKAKKLLLGGEALTPTATATTVRVRDGKTLTTDGPFAETKEQLGGFYLLDCEDLDQAIEYAGKIPSARYGSIEVRPIMKFD